MASVMKKDIVDEVPGALRLVFLSLCLWLDAVPGSCLASEVKLYYIAVNSEK